MTDAHLEERDTPRYPNVIPPNQRGGMWSKDRYSSGPVRDGHKILRNVCDEDGIEIVHPKACLEAEAHSVEWLCPLAAFLEGVDDVLDLYCDGRESAHLDAERRLPRDVEVEITWEVNSGASWTDYGWEYDAECSWWYGDEPWLEGR